MILFQSFLYGQISVMDEKRVGKCNRFIHSLYICEMTDKIGTSHITGPDRKMGCEDSFFMKNVKGLCI